MRVLYCHRSRKGTATIRQTETSKRGGDRIIERPKSVVALLRPEFRSLFFPSPGFILLSVKFVKLFRTGFCVRFANYVSRVNASAGGYGILPDWYWDTRAPKDA